MQSAVDPDISRHRRERLAVFFGVATTIVLILFALSFLHNRGLINVPGLPQSENQTVGEAISTKAVEAEEVSPVLAERDAAWEQERLRLLSPTKGI